MEENRYLIPISYIVKAQNHFVKVFYFEDNGVDWFESKEYGAAKRAVHDYIEKMFLDDKETTEIFEHWLGQSILPGTYKEICDLLRAQGYTIISKDNATLDEMKAVEKMKLKLWKDYKCRLK